MNGSSPRLWGTRLASTVRFFIGRFIPTAVGNAHPTCRSPPVWPVHPHGCGERRYPLRVGVIIRGSSPRLWGTLCTESFRYFLSRFIPTAVGNAMGAGHRWQRPAVHPHGCGERDRRALALAVVCGSSPRLWGTRAARWWIYDKQRFIPTAVGNASGGGRVWNPQPVHPHGCGERMLMELAIGLKDGSSPRLWGTRAGGKECGATRRFIPTAVGNAARFHTGQTQQSVHPHGCGERPPNDCAARDNRGSSPRLWGTHPCRGGVFLRLRFIPTAVGNACQKPSSIDYIPVHPHGCGERHDRTLDMSNPYGSSPRLWGTLRLESRHSPIQRFIPTAVGNAKTRLIFTAQSLVHPHGCGERGRLD